MPQTLVLIGSGPGIGLSVATLFATRAFSTIALLSRDATRLSSDRSAILAATKGAGKEVDVKTFAVDVAGPEFEKSLEEVGKLGNVSCVVFNAARVGPDTMFEMGEEQMIFDFKTTNIGVYKTAKWAFPLFKQLPADTKPMFFVTSCLFAIDPIPQYFGLFVVKAGQRSLVQSLQKLYGEEVHVALVNVQGVVSPDNPDLNPDLIAERFWGVYEQKKEEWKPEVNVPEGSAAFLKESIPWDI